MLNQEVGKQNNETAIISFLNQNLIINQNVFKVFVSAGTICIRFHPFLKKIFVQNKKIYIFVQKKRILLWQRSFITVHISSDPFSVILHVFIKTQFISGIINRT